MSEPSTIRQLLAAMTVLQGETNTLLRRLVPDNRDFPGGLYDLLRFGLYRATPDAAIPDAFTFTPQPALLYDLLRDEVAGLDVAAIASVIATNTANTRTAAAATSTNVFDLLTFLGNQLSPGTITLNIAEQLAVIRENTAATDGNADLLDALNVLALQTRTLVSTDEGLVVRNVAELLYALGVCSCPTFPPVTLQPAPPPIFPTCLELTAGQGQARFQFGPAQALTPGVLFNVTYDVYVHPVTATGVYPAQGHSINPISSTNGNAYFLTRDNTLTWTGAGASFGWAEPVTTSTPVIYLNVPWTVATGNPTQSQVQAMIDTRSGSINLRTQGRCLAPTVFPTTANPNTPANWRAAFTLWPVGGGPSSQAASQYMYGRFSPPPGI